MMTKMRELWIVVIVSSLFIQQGFSIIADDDIFSSSRPRLDAEMKERIRNLIQHMKQDEPVGMPGLPIPDPMPIPPMKHQLPVATLTFDNSNVHGLSLFKLDYVRIDLTALQVSVGMAIDNLKVLGKYSMSNFFTRSKGDYNITILGVEIEASVHMDVDKDGFLNAQDIDVDIRFTELKIKFENLGVFGKIFQGFVNSVGTFVFNSIKPMILEQANKNIRGQVNERFRQFPQRFPNSISPLDTVIHVASEQIKQRGFDPFKLPAYKSTSWFKVELYNGVLYGASTVHRTGNMTFGFAENVVHMTMSVGTQEMSGHYDWELGLPLMTRKGHISFSIDSFSIFIIFSQPANLDKKASLEDMQITLGNIAVRSEGAGTADYAVEVLFNVLPNILRDQIMKAVEGPAKAIIQDRINGVDLEALINKKLDQL